MGPRKMVERALGDQRRHLGAPAAGEMVLLDDEQPSGLRDRALDRGDVERHEAADIDHLRIDPLPGESLGRRKRPVDHQHVGEDREVAPLATHRDGAERHLVVAIGHVGAEGDRGALPARAFAAVEELVLEEHDRIVVADGGEEQPLGIVGRRRTDDLEAGRVHEERLGRLPVLGAALGRADRQAEHHRHAHLAVAHVVHLGGLVDHLIHGAEDEVAVLHLGDRPHADHGRADRGADDRASEIGVSITRSRPNSSESPSVTVKPPPNPPGTPMSSPIRKTRGSARIAIRMASRSASAMPIRFVGLA